MPDEITFFVAGLPRPGGSKKGFYIKKLNRVSITEDNPKSKEWRAIVAYTAKIKCDKPIMGPLQVTFQFRMVRPMGHYGTGKKTGILKSSSPKFPVGKPDITKLIRSTEDALKGICWNDDSQIVLQSGEKLYAQNDSAGCLISIRSMKIDPINSLLEAL